MIADDSLPDDVETLKRLVRAGEADLARARAEASSAAALIAHLRLTIEKMRREIYGPRSERKVRLLEQLELELEELEAAAAEDDLAAEKVAASASDTTAVRGFTREKPSRKPFPAHLPRERVIVPGPTACACCGSHLIQRCGNRCCQHVRVRQFVHGLFGKPTPVRGARVERGHPSTAPTEYRLQLRHGCSSKCCSRRGNLSNAVRRAGHARSTTSFAKLIPEGLLG